MVHAEEATPRSAGCRGPLPYPLVCFCCGVHSLWSAWTLLPNQHATHATFLLAQWIAQHATAHPCVTP